MSMTISLIYMEEVLNEKTKYAYKIGSRVMLHHCHHFHTDLLGQSLDQKAGL